MTFVDVGANIGLFSVVAAHCVGPSGRVIAVEPQKGLAEVFWDNLRMNDLSNIIHQPVALGSAPGTSNLFQVTENDGQATLRLRPGERSVGPVAVVVVRRLSDLLREHNVASVDGLKIDVEGSELEVLEGFQDWIAVRPPRFIFFECSNWLLERFGHRNHDLVGFLQRHGYTVYEPLRHRWAPIVMSTLRSGNLLALHGG